MSCVVKCCKNRSDRKKKNPGITFHSCSQCSFTAQFESALSMHRQLHHETTDVLKDKPKDLPIKSQTKPRAGPLETTFAAKDFKGLKLTGRTASATRLFGKIRAKICRSRTLFAHPEETDQSFTANDLSATSECTSKALKVESTLSRSTACIREAPKETYVCHLCSFEADRITVLDRHLLNYHKIGLENLLKLVLAKTKDGLSEDTEPELFGLHEPYYKPQEDMTDEGEFVIETLTPNIKILKHMSTNTDLKWTDIPNLKDDCRIITREMDKLIKCPVDKNNQVDFMVKMQTLNDCMCKFVDSSNTLKKALNKEFDSKLSVRKDHGCDEPIFDLGLGDQDTPREWERAHSEKLDRSRGNKPRGEKSKLSAESFYY